MHEATLAISQQMGCITIVTLKSIAAVIRVEAGLHSGPHDQPTQSVK